ncbi:hypothetical protein HYPSUDRAFT_138698 [Hypholoma sublateritium FD-334 SS-4]|uniref:CHAT domain-containing protein n=1 Tax=Hypholoma sublateritium (strain FD-334 SS-4) TaxID=945553 RepID=A0A0D2P256_HYPSF|nr:hypothetical protein HYPSUDRAFT_138698 [Hypholoma sublateritium FD-334 SS-4]
MPEIRQADALYETYKETQDIDILKTAIVHYQSAVSLCPPNSDVLFAIFNNLGNSYLCQFEHTGNLEDIEHAIFHQQNAVKSTPPGHTDLPSQLNNLGRSYLCKFEQTGNLQDIEHAIFHQQNAVNSTSSDYANLPIYLNNLGNSYLRQFEYTGNLQDIEHAIVHLQNAVNSTPSGHADLPRFFNTLGNLYSCQFEYTGNHQDIEHAIFHLQNAVNCTSSGHANLPIYLSNLGSSYFCQFQYTGNLQDIEHAILHQQNAVNSTPPDHANFPKFLTNLGNSYLWKFNYTGKLQDIQHAIFHHQNSVNSTPSGHTDLPHYFNNLGNSYHCQFEHTGNLQDIEYAIFHYQNAVNSASPNYAGLPRYINNLGNAFLCQFQSTGNLQDIEHAIFHHQKAVDSTPSDHADLPICLNSLGNSYYCQFEHTGNLQDIEHAIFHLQNAINSTPSDNAGLSDYFNNLGNSYLCQFEHTQNQKDIEHAIFHYQNAAAVANGTPSICLKSAETAAELSLIHDKSHCLNDFSIAINLLSEVAGLEQTIHQRHANLHGHSEFLALAVATAFNFSRFDLALEWLENGRCLVWNQLSQLRTPINSLHIKHPSLASHFIQVANTLDFYGTRSALSHAPSMNKFSEDIHMQNEIQNHTRHATQYKQLLEEIQGLPDFHDFLKPPKFTDILEGLPPNGPIIIFNIHSLQCDALALIPGADKPLHISLENFNIKDAETLQKNLQSGILKLRDIENIEIEAERLGARRKIPKTMQMSFILQELWSKVVQPILKALAYLIPPTSASRPRIWWCPTGPLAFLPLHAAGVYGKSCLPGSCISDYVVSSYTPTIHSIQEKFAASSTLSGPTKLLLISQPNTPGLRPIPATKTEINALDILMEGTANVNTLLLQDAEATIDKVKDEMKSHNWVHFACHGIQSQKNPLESGVYLHDGCLELLEIMKHKTDNSKLAFLSACQTSMGDNKLSEEVVHFTARMLSAGYCGVIGTMWGISDPHGPKFAEEFYKYLLNKTGSEGLDSTHAAYALDYATRQVCQILGQDDTSFLTWVPYIHFGY